MNTVCVPLTQNRHQPWTALVGTENLAWPWSHVLLRLAGKPGPGSTAFLHALRLQCGLPSLCKFRGSRIHWQMLLFVEWYFLGLSVPGTRLYLDGFRKLVWKGPWIPFQWEPKDAAGGRWGEVTSTEVWLGWDGTVPQASEDRATAASRRWGAVGATWFSSPTKAAVS